MCFFALSDCYHKVTTLPYYSLAMSGSVTNFGATLTGGIQDISALLPLIGTEQCEKHVGSALEGGFLLGIVKAGISVLVASISIPKPSLSALPTLSFSELPAPSLKFTPLPKLSFISSRHPIANFYDCKPKSSFARSRRLWCGARVLDNAGFKLVGSVAPLIGMDAKRYKAESRLIEILEEKHIDTPEKLSINWRSTEWNASLVIGTLITALFSGTPYLYLLLKDASGSIHSPWVFPFLRTVGSCLTTVCCQFLIQSRVISLMKSRLIFMIVHSRLVDDLKKGKGGQAESILKEQELFRWDDSFPAEECLWSLEQYLRSQVQVNGSFGDSQPSHSTTRLSGARDLEANNPSSSKDKVEGRSTRVQSYISPPSGPAPPFSDPDRILHTLLKQHTDHFHTRRAHRIFIIVCWLLLLVSIPTAVAGYIGCFTIVTNSYSDGPLVWLGLETILSALRIFLWAWNPSFDERTGVEVSLKLTEGRPPMTTHWSINALHAMNDCQVSLVPERRFLKQITSYTGPLGSVHFKRPNNIALYFVLTVNKEHTQRGLLMIVLDLTDRTAITVYHGSDFGFGTDPVCFNTLVTLNTDTSAMVATIHWHSPIGTDHPQWSKNPVRDLAKYYDSLLQSLNRRRPVNHPVAHLRWKWSLDPSEENAERNEEGSYWGSAPLNLTNHNILRFQQSHEHHLKTRLMHTFGKWIVKGVKAMHHDGRNDCHFTLADPTSDEAKQELYAFNVLLVREWTKRELAHLQLSAALENLLRAHVQQNGKELVNAEQRMSSSQSQWSYELQKQRLEHERAHVKARGEDMMKTVGQGLSEQNELASIWQAGRAFVEKWAAAIESGSFEEAPSVFFEVTTECDDDTRPFVKRLKSKFTRWNYQRNYQQREMEATLERISKAELKQLEQAYKLEYPAWLVSLIHSKFAWLPYDSEESTFVAKLSSAMVYDASWVPAIDVISTVAAKSSCCSLINVGPSLIQDIPENDHLLFCSDEDHQEVNLPFIQRNRDRWWEQQRSDLNSWTFYLSPQGVDYHYDSRYVYSWEGTIAHIMIFLQTSPTRRLDCTRLRLRLHLLHSREGDAILSIQEKGKDSDLGVFDSTEVYESRDELRLQDYDLGWFEPGRHELQLVVMQTKGWYRLRDIALEFVDLQSG